MESRGETSELQQLVSSDAENDDSTIQEDPTDTTESKVMSPIRSAKFSSSGNTSHSSVTRSLGKGYIAPSIGGSKIAYINERKPAREPVKPSTARPRNTHKDPPKPDTHHHSFLSQVPDVRHMERALLGLLADFHSGKLRAFGGGCTMEQMTNIREQQEKLAKLHFDLGGAATIPSLTDESLKNSQNTMSQLIQRLEQLSVSIEALQSNSTK
ncbi:coiled-coil domain-containing protein 28A isoform X2 [Anthonomus grandis grandis]|uniref:coiled-coil domain-containing protein 28A isoform X2 n=1 Tax=Anthonomus grandis grandis TaxID=2921223 RepID=UPI0021662953|nr:coiled-coil domain-containing protein 28A isoform X2 [Anthonomus grandis grandis]